MKDSLSLYALSAHEGSLSFKESIKVVGTQFDSFSYHFLVTDKQYRDNRSHMRIFNRIRVFILFPLFVILKLTSIIKADRVLVVTSPFFLPLLLSIFINSNKLIILHNDIYPEGFGFKKNFLSEKISRIIIFLYERLLKRAKCNIFISKKHLNSKNLLYKRLIYTPAISRKVPKIKSNHRLIGYVGTLNSNHCGLEFLNCLSKTNFSEKTTFTFNISGSLKKEFLNHSNSLPDLNNAYLEIAGPLDEAEYISKMNQINYGLILLSEKGSGTVFPSKFPAHLSFGHPVILLSDQKNELHDFILEKDIGLSINILDKDLNQLDDLLKNTNYDKLRSNSINTFREFFDHQRIATEIREAIL